MEKIGSIIFKDNINSLEELKKRMTLCDSATRLEKY